MVRGRDASQHLFSEKKKSTRTKIRPHSKNVHLKQIFLNNFRWVPDSCHREEGKSSRELLEKVRVNTVSSWCFWISGGGFGLYFGGMRWPVFWNRYWGRGRDEAELSEEKPFHRIMARHSVNEGFGNEFYRKYHLVKSQKLKSSALTSPSQISVPSVDSGATANKLKLAPSLLIPWCCMEVHEIARDFSRTQYRGEIFARLASLHDWPDTGLVLLVPSSLHCHD